MQRLLKHAHMKLPLVILLFAVSSAVAQTATPTPRWEQAFSPDEGKSWETNWITVNNRID